ncbi:hypothetical protein HaLaN_13923 [Haematococcus lacustris]|uniref:Uncharacterized protein n=1 Tax=Haematococcus lacustris TaxID=44745 RepID=A0A699ZEK3_HAELA|nr:hypothetical protein HaLaN_13923 [Haematococcus lacustris]
MGAGVAMGEAWGGEGSAGTAWLARGSTGLGAAGRAGGRRSTPARRHHSHSRTIGGPRTCMTRCWLRAATQCVGCVEDACPGYAAASLHLLQARAQPGWTPVPR